MNSACQTNSQNWEGEMFLKVVFKQALHPQQTPYAYIHEFASTYKNKSNAFNCANTAVLVKSSCLCMSVWNNNYEPSFPKTDALNWLWNITVSVNVHSCWYKSHLCGCNRDSIYKTCNRWWTKKKFMSSWQCLLLCRYLICLIDPDLVWVADYLILFDCKYKWFSQLERFWKLIQF